MRDSKRRLLGMGLPFGLVFLADTALAAGVGRELDPGDTLFFHVLAQFHPLALVAGYFAWAAVVVGLILVSPEVLAVVVTIAAVGGHTAGAYSQLAVALGGWWYQAANGLFLVAAVALGTGLWWSARAEPQPAPAAGRTAWLRWGLVAVLLAAGAGMLLVPWQA
jgi:hypothetical protein